MKDLRRDTDIFLFEALEMASGEIDRRFKQSDIGLMLANGEQVTQTETLLSYIEKDVDKDRLTMLADVLLHKVPPLRELPNSGLWPNV